MAVTSGGLIDLEINNILRETNKLTNTREYELTLHTTDKDMYITMPISIEKMSNFNKSVSDEIFVEFRMMMGDFVKEVHPYRDNLELTITTTNKSDNSSSSVRYKLIVLNNVNNMNSDIYIHMTKDELNKTGMIEVQAQCLLREVEAARTKYFDGIFRSVTVKDLMLHAFSNGLGKLKVEGTALNVRCDIVKPNNDYNFLQILIPAGTKLLDLPTVLQDTTYGVYNGSIGSYLTSYKGNTTMFVYPLYDPERFNNTTKKLIVFHSNNSKFNYVENTYKQDGDVLKLIAGTDVKITDSGENEMMNSGNGIVGSAPNLIMRRNFVVDDSGMTMSKEAQISGSTAKDRRDGVDNPNYVGNETNLYKHRSQINKISMGTYQIPWKYSNSDLIYPGMPVCYSYEDETNGIMKLNGVVQIIYERYTFALKTHNAVLTAMVQKPSVYLNQ